MIIRLARLRSAIDGPHLTVHEANLDVRNDCSRQLSVETVRATGCRPLMTLRHSMNPARIAEAERISPSFSAKERSLTKAFWVSAAVHASRRSPRAALEPPSCRLTSIARASRARRSCDVVIDRATDHGGSSRVVLDQEYLARLGQFDIVYSWGVLHHTGSMWQVMENVKPLVKPGRPAIHCDLQRLW